MLIQRDYSALRIFKYIIPVYFCINIRPLSSQDYDLRVQEYWRKIGKSYVPKGQRFVGVPRQNLPTPFHEISPKNREDQWERIKKNRGYHPELWFTGGGNGGGCESPSWNENRRKHEGSGRRSGFNDETNFRRSGSLSSYWEAIFDGRIIAAIGSLFSKSIKDESNRERLERNKLRETLLLKNLTGMINDPVQFDILKKESKNAPRYINQVIRRAMNSPQINQIVDSQNRP